MSGRGRGRGGGGGGGGGPRGGPRGGARGGVPLVGRGAGPAITSVTPAEHVQTVGVRRKNPGTAGTAVRVITNHFEVNIPDLKYIHYDGAFLAATMLTNLTMNTASHLVSLTMMLFYACTAGQ